MKQRNKIHTHTPFNIKIECYCLGAFDLMKL